MWITKNEKVFQFTTWFFWHWNWENKFFPLNQRKKESIIGANRSLFGKEVAIREKAR